MASGAELAMILRVRNEASAGLRSAADDVERVSKRMSNIGNAMTIGVTLPALAAGGAVLKMAANAIESENLFEVSMKGMSGAAREFSEKVSEALGLNAYEIRRQVGDWNVLLRQLGANEEAAYGMSKGLTMLAYDLASFRNLNPEEVFAKLRSGMVGETEAVKSLGIVLTEINMKQFALDNGIIKTSRDLTESEKMLIRYRMIVEKSAEAQGDLARTMDSPINQMRRMEAQTKALMISLGMELMPVASAGLTWLANTGFPRVQAEVKTLTDNWREMGPEGQRNVLLIAGMLVAGGPLLKGMSTAITGVRAMAAAFVALKATALPELVAIGAAMAALNWGWNQLVQNVPEGTEVFDEFGNRMFVVDESMKQVADNGGPLREMLGGIASAAGNVVADLSNFDDLLRGLGESEGDNTNITQNWKKSLSELMAEIYGFKPGLDMFNGAVGDTAKKAKEAKDALAAAGFSINDMAVAVAANHPVVQGLSLRVVGLKDQLAATNVAIEANAAAQRAIQDAIRATQERISTLNEELSKAKQHLSDLSSPRLTGMGAIDDQIFEAEQAIKRLQLVGAGGVLPSGIGLPTGNITGWQQELERLRLLRDVTYEPMLRQLQMAANPPMPEMGFGAALAAIQQTKAEIAGLESQLASETNILRAQEAALRGLQAEQDALRESAAQLQAQIAMSEQQHKRMSEALVAGIVWLIEGSVKAKEYGGTVAEQATVVDEETKKLLKVFMDFSLAHSQTTIADVDAAVAKWEAAKARIDQLAAEIASRASSVDMGIPGYQHGTSYHPGGLAIVGEAGPELLRLPRGSAVAPMSGSYGYSGGSNIINVYVAGSVVTTRELAMDVRDELVKIQGRNYTVGIRGA